MAIETDIAAKPVQLNAGAPATIEPVIATPRTEPVCRLAEAMEAATPAWLFGMPDTAVLEIGAFTRPHAIPNRT